MTNKILLIDADSSWPNIALMKISTFHKKKGDVVTLRRPHLSYYPYATKKTYTFTGYDKIYCSVLFEGNKEYIKGDNIIFGGTGSGDISKKLPEEMEDLELDYSLYPNNDTSYGFLTRGCIRNCDFCIVREKEGKLKQVATIDDILRHDRVYFLDNNILALPSHKEILQELIDRHIKCRFSSGLDIRLIDEENSLLLLKLNYIRDFTFAFDDWKDRKKIEDKLKLLEWRKNWQFRFYLYTNPNDDLSNLVNRVNWCKENKVLPYVMRDISCWKSEYKDFYTDVAGYCNQPGIFKKIDFDTFLKKRLNYTDNRIERNSTLFESKGEKIISLERKEKQVEKKKREYKRPNLIYPKNPIGKCVSCVFFTPSGVRTEGECICNESSIHRRNRYAGDRSCRFYKYSDSFEQKKDVVVVSFSGGKDSTAMLHKMLENGEKIDEVVFFETGWDFPQMEDHIKKVERNTGIDIIRIRHYMEFDELLKRWGWPHYKGGWCVSCKIQALDKFTKFVGCTTGCIGYSTNETKRADKTVLNIKRYNVRFPLIENNINKKEALKYCKSLGYDWGGLYDIFNRVSCWCCPKAGINSIEKIKIEFPELYERFLEMDEIAKDKHAFIAY